MEIDPKTKCWNWKSGIDAYGYGQASFGRSNKVKAHRLSYETYIGPADNLLVCHHCDNTKCINPKHLFLGDHYDNRMDSVKKGRHKKKDENKLSKEQRTLFTEANGWSNPGSV